MMSATVEEAEAAHASGDWERAAHLFEDAGHHARAAALYEHLLLFADAARAHAAAGAVVAALCAAARARVPAVEGTALESARAVADAAQLQQAARAVEDMGRHDLAARLFDAAGDVEASARAHEASGSLAVAARRRLSAGQQREAGVLLEQHLRANPADRAAMLELGSVLAGFGRHDAAGPLFREAAMDPALAPSALKRLASGFMEQGLVHAAQRVLEELARASPGAPRDVLALANLQAPRDDSDRTGTRVDRRYVVMRPLGASSIGDTYAAHDAFTDRQVHLQLFRPAVIGSEALGRFAAACQAAGALQRADILPVYEFNTAQGFMATAVPSGRTLESWLRTEEPIPADRVVRGVGAVLEALHRRGLHHGALHAGCIHVSEIGNVQVGEVGAGALLALRETESLGLDSALATMPPEMLAGGMPGPAGDQYALAAVAYRLVVGTWPSSSSVPRYAAVDNAQVDAVLRRALSARARDRFESVAAFLAALPPLDAGRSAPPAVVEQPHAGERMVPQGEPVRVEDGVRWQRMRDTHLERTTWEARGPVGSLSLLRMVAPLDAGVELVTALEADGARAWVVPVEHHAVDGHAHLLAWASVARALAALHAEAITLGTCRARRITEGFPCIRLCGLPPLHGGGPAEAAADMDHLHAVVVSRLGAWAESLPREPDALARALEERAARPGLRMRGPGDTPPASW